jgi:hypothetical protein
MPLTDPEVAGKLVEVINEFRRLDSKFPIQWVFAFLYVAANEDCKVGDVARALRVVPPTATVVLNGLSERKHDLIKRLRGRPDQREKRVGLTRRGKALMRAIAAHLSDPPTRRST